jgi:hypothetical protein
MARVEAKVRLEDAPEEGRSSPTPLTLSHFAR